MAFTAHIDNVTLQNDQWIASVTFSDSATAWVSTKIYTFPASETQAQMTAQIIADGTIYKANLITLNALQAKVGSVITI
jgi:hypothetical protein